MYFNCTTADQVQLRYDELCKVFNDQDEMLQALKLEYSTLMSVLTESKPFETVKENISIADIIKALQEKVNPEGLHLQLCGSWAWLSGRTYPIKDTLKELGFRYSVNKLAWYYREADHRSGNQKPVPFEFIKEKYGSKEVALR